MYKLITLIITLNLAMSMGTTFIVDGATFDDFLGKNTANRLISSAQNIQDIGGDPDSMLTKQNAEKQEVNGGIATSTLAIAIMYYTIIWKILFGGLITLGALAFSLYSNDNTMLAIIGWLCAMFVASLYIWLGMKLWTWFHSKDTQ